MRDEKQVEIAVNARTREFHNRALVVDLHTDCLIAARMLGVDLSKRHRPPLNPATPWMLHADIPKLKEGGVDAVFLGIVTHPWPRKAYDRALRAIDYAHYVVRKNERDLSFASGPDDIERARAGGRIAVMLGVEGMHMLGGHVSRIEEFYRLGARYITLAHFTSNRITVSSADLSRKRVVGSSELFEALDLMSDLGMMVDLSHTHTDIIRAVCSRASAPVIVSHGAASAVKPVFRNLTDADIESVASTGGVIGLIYASKWLAQERPRPDLSVVVDHADHIKRLVGCGYLALGSDWDGLIMTPRGMKDASDLPALTQVFFDRGYSEEEVEGILGGNFMRAFRAATELAHPGPSATERARPGPSAAEE